MPVRVGPAAISRGRGADQSRPGPGIGRPDDAASLRSGELAFGDARPGAVGSASIAALTPGTEIEPSAGTAAWAFPTTRAMEAVDPSAEDLWRAVDPGRLGRSRTSRVREADEPAFVVRSTPREQTSRWSARERAAGQSRAGASGRRSGRPARRSPGIENGRAGRGPRPPPLPGRGPWPFPGRGP
jgi:hypothetical protein